MSGLSLIRRGARIATSVMLGTVFAVSFYGSLRAEGGGAPLTPLVAATSRSVPDPQANPVLADIMRYGARIFYMGRLGAADSWFIYKNRQIQFAYTFGDGQNALIGVMFGPNGQGVTAQQFDALINTNSEVSQLMKTATSTTSSPEDRAALGNQVAAVMLGGGTADGQSSLGKLPMASVDTQAASAPAPAIGSPAERLFADLSKASGVDLGSDAAPLVLMVMSPSCPHCKTSWRALRDAVQGGKVRVRLIPVAATPEDEALGARLLHVADPLMAWDKFVGNALGGDKAQLSGTVDEASRKAVKDNYVIADSWSIRDTPYFAYRAKNGKIKVLRGEPEKVSAFLDDVAAP